MEFSRLWGISNVLNSLEIKNTLDFTAEMGFKWFWVLGEFGAVFGIRWDRSKLKLKMRMKWRPNEEGSF